MADLANRLGVDGATSRTGSSRERGPLASSPCPAHACRSEGSTPTTTGRNVVTFYLSINQIRPVGDDVAEFIETPDRPDRLEVESAATREVDPASADTRVAPPPSASH